MLTVYRGSRTSEVTDAVRVTLSSGACLYIVNAGGVLVIQAPGESRLTVLSIETSRAFADAIGAMVDGE